MPRTIVKLNPWFFLMFIIIRVLPPVYTFSLVSLLGIIYPSKFMPSAWWLVLPSAVSSYSPAKTRFIDRRYQGVPDGGWLAIGLTSLYNIPA
jgi:hypothetical protein